MAHMYAGRMLSIDLSDGKAHKEPTAAYAGALVGGRGINIRLLYDRVPPEVGALDAQNVLILGTGPLCCTPVPASRVEVTAKSPETGFLGQANIGGTFGPELKFAGYDHLLVTGKAERPVYVWIDNDRVEIRDAAHLWGKDTYETQDIIHSELDPEARVVCIGKAGENLVRFATIQHEPKHAGGRTGMGAVMGSKNLKAIVVRGTGDITLADPLQYLTVAEKIQRKLTDHPAIQMWQKYGMSQYLDLMHETMNSEFMARSNLRRFDVYKKYKPKKSGCLGCPVQCNDVYPTVAKGGGAISCTFYSTPLFSVGNTNIDLGLECSFYAIKNGVDIVSAMRIILWLMELYEEGIITAQDTDGIQMERGCREAIFGMLKKIVNRQGFGDILANGMLAAANKIGRGAIDYANQIKGLPIYASIAPEDTIPQKGTSLSLAISSRGDTMRARTRYFVEEIDIMKGFADSERAVKDRENRLSKAREIAGTDKASDPREYEGKAELAVYSEDTTIICDCLGVCKYMGPFELFVIDVKDEAELLSVGMGSEIGEEKLFKIAKRVRHMERAYNVREGMTREHDSLPKRFMDRRLTSGRELKTTEFEQMKDRYYNLRGWNIETGIPTRKELELNGLKDIALDLEKRGKLPELVQP